jgi:DDE superfamily endonuclease
MSVVNAPGSVHDSTLAHWGKVYDRLEACHELTGGVCCVDSAFLSGEQVPYLIKSSEDLSKAKSALEMVQMREATSLRQAAEWGMRAIQGAFPRMKDRFHYEENGERKVFLTLVCLLYNYRLEKVGLNQLRNTYVPGWSRDVEDVMDGV